MDIVHGASQRMDINTILKYPSTLLERLQVMQYLKIL